MAMDHPPQALCPRERAVDTHQGWCGHRRVVTGPGPDNPDQVLH